MPTLKNARHEQFAQNIVLGAKQGWTQGECYQRAGYKSGGHSAEVSGSKLLKKIDVSRRVAELMGAKARKVEVSVDSLLTQLEDAVSGATQAEQFGAVNGAIALMGKLKGLLRDRVEVGAPGDFANLDTPEAVIDSLVTSLGGAREALEAFDVLRLMLEARAAEDAQDVTPEPPRRLAHVVGEADRSLEALRPTQKARR